MRKIGMFAMCILTSLSIVAFAQEGYTHNVKIPSAKGVYTTGIQEKKEAGHQSYYNNRLYSNHDGTEHPIMVTIRNMKTGQEDEFTKVNSESYFNPIWGYLHDPGLYMLKLKNSTWSVYTYTASGTWYYTK